MLAGDLSFNESMNANYELNIVSSFICLSDARFRYMKMFVSNVLIRIDPNCNLVSTLQIEKWPSLTDSRIDRKRLTP